MTAKPWRGDIKCAACGKVDARIVFKKGKREMTVFPNANGKMNLRKDPGGIHALICSACGSQTPYPAEAWRGFF